MVEMAGSWWRKSSYSGSGGQQDGCVEVARYLPNGVAVRDSKDPGGHRLAFSAADWKMFIRRVKTGASDLA